MREDYPAILPNPRERLVAALNARKEVFAHWQKVAAVLQKFDGKKITKAFETAVVKQLGYTAFYKKDFSWYSLSVWNNGLPYDKRLNLNLGYFNENDEIFNYAAFVKRSGCYALEEQRLPAFEAGIDAAVRKAAEYEVARLELERLSKELDDYRHYMTK